ncbi:MAG: hypothetical protein Q9226_000465 [Calogaya cf. arnoldii]
MSHNGVKPGEHSQQGSSRPPLWLSLRSSKWFIGIASFIATFTDGVLYSVLEIVPLLPFSLVERSGVQPDMVQSWITILFVVFGLSMVLGAPIAGWITQHSSLRQVPLVMGLMAALAATLLFMLAKALWILVLARCLQGVSAGVVYTTVLALLVETVERDEVGSWIGFALSGVNLGVLVAPVLAGVLYEKAGYYAVFAICLAIIAIDLLGAILLIDKKRARKWSLDSQQTGDGSKQGSSAPATPVMEQRDGLHHSRSFTTTTLDGNNRSDTTTARPSRQVDEVSPLLENSSTKAKMSPKKWFPTTRALFASPQILAALYSTFIHSTLHTSFDAVLPRFVQRTFHWNSSGAGLIFLTLTVPSLMSPLFGFLGDRYGRRIVALGGFALTVPCLALLGLVQNGELSKKILLGLFLVLIDMSFAVERLEHEDPQFAEDSSAYTEAYALVDVTFGLGAVIGPLFSGLLYEKTTWAITYGVFAIFTFSGSIPVVSTLKCRDTSEGTIINDLCRCCTHVAHRLAKNTVSPKPRI